MSFTNIAQAKYVQERLPLSKGMLQALSAYLRRFGWQEVEPGVYEGNIDGPIRVKVSRDPFTRAVKGR